MLNEEKVSKFVDAIAREAEERYAEIISETDEYIKSETARAEREIATEYEDILQKKVSALKTEIGRQILENRNKNRAELVNRRMKIVSDVFDSVKAKILAFKSGEEYKILLQNSVENATRVCKNIKTVYISKSDLAHAEMIKKTIKNQCEIVTDDTIILGGLKFKNDSGTILADDTLDTRLITQRDNFASLSGLFMENM